MTHVSSTNVRRDRRSHALTWHSECFVLSMEFHRMRMLRPVAQANELLAQAGERAL
jgi:hypothetical protein